MQLTQTYQCGQVVRTLEFNRARQKCVHLLKKKVHLNSSLIFGYLKNMLFTSEVRLGWVTSQLEYIKQQEKKSNISSHY